jgi:hypothetical protein
MLYILKHLKNKFTEREGNREEVSNDENRQQTENEEENIEECDLKSEPVVVEGNKRQKFE